MFIPHQIIKVDYVKLNKSKNVFFVYEFVCNGVVNDSTRTTMAIDITLHEVSISLSFYKERR